MSGTKPLSEWPAGKEFLAKLDRMFRSALDPLTMFKAFQEKAVASLPQQAAPSSRLAAFWARRSATHRWKPAFSAASVRALPTQKASFFGRRQSNNQLQDISPTCLAMSELSLPTMTSSPLPRQRLCLLFLRF